MSDAFALKCALILYQIFDFFIFLYNQLMQGQRRLCDAKYCYYNVPRDNVDVDKRTHEIVLCPLCLKAQYCSKRCRDIDWYLCIVYTAQDSEPQEVLHLGKPGDAGGPGDRWAQQIGQRELRLGGGHAEVDTAAP